MKFDVFRKLLVVAGILVLALLAFGCGGEELSSDLAAKVGDTEITVDQLDTRVAEIQAQLGEQVPTEEQDPEGFETFRQQVLDYLITVELVNQKAAEAGIEVSEEEVDTQVEQIKGMFGGDDAKFEEAIAEQNLTVPELRDNLREQELIKKMIEEATKDVSVSQEEVEAAYEEKKDSLQVGETRKTRHILFSPGSLAEEPGAEVTDAEWQAALEEAQQVREEIMGGADFAEMAKQHSDDPGSKEEGGDLGNVQRGTMVPEFDETVFSLEEGAISEPVKTQFGYHLIQVQEINPERTPSLEEVQEALKAELEDEAKRVAWEDWLKSTREELNVVVQDGLEYVTTTTEAVDATAATDEGVTEDTTGTSVEETTETTE